MVNILLLVGLEPRLLIVEANAPKKLVGLLRKSLKHVIPSFLLGNFRKNAGTQMGPGTNLAGEIRERRSVLLL